MGHIYLYVFHWIVQHGFTLTHEEKVLLYPSVRSGNVIGHGFICTNITIVVLISSCSGFQIKPALNRVWGTDISIFFIGELRRYILSVGSGGTKTTNVDVINSKDIKWGYIIGDKYNSGYLILIIFKGNLIWEVWRNCSLAMFLEPKIPG